jgi:transcriptional regulator with XRE-family HTH domain
MGEVPSFGAWLKRRRKALDLTQEGLARLVGCAVVSIRKIEADEQRPSRQTAERLAQHLQLAPHEQATFVQFARLGLDDVPPALPILAAAHLPEAPPPPQRAVSAAAQPASDTPIARPSGTVTFLFTDIEGSTRLWEQHPDLMLAALDEVEREFENARRLLLGAPVWPVGTAAEIHGRLDLLHGNALASNRGRRTLAACSGQRCRGGTQRSAIGATSGPGSLCPHVAVVFLWLARVV